MNHAKIRTNKWTDKQGVERYTTEIVASEMQMLGKKTNQEVDEPSSQQEAVPVDSMDVDSAPFWF